MVELAIKRIAVLSAVSWNLVADSCSSIFLESHVHHCESLVVAIHHHYLGCHRASVTLWEGDHPPSFSLHFCLALFFAWSCEYLHAVVHLVFASGWSILSQFPCYNGLVHHSFHLPSVGICLSIAHARKICFSIFFLPFSHPWHSICLSVSVSNHCDANAPTFWFSCSHFSCGNANIGPSGPFPAPKNFQKRFEYFYSVNTLECLAIMPLSAPLTQTP